MMRARWRASAGASSPEIDVLLGDRLVEMNVDLYGVCDEFRRRVYANSTVENMA
jgi:hypothetical protein